MGCGIWLDSLFGTDKVKLKPQKLMWLPAIRSASDLKDGPTMNGRVGGTLSNFPCRFDTQAGVNSI